MALYEREVDTVEIGGANFDARLAMRAMDEIITDIYLPFRGADGYETERAVLVESPHVPHRENDAEHSWSLGFAALVIYDMRAELGLNLPPDFDIGQALALANIHDVPEIRARDVDAMSSDTGSIFLKKVREQEAFSYFLENYPNLQGVMERWQTYERKDTAEAQFVSDLDKIFATRVIYLDGGKKWHGWEGYQTSREDMVTRVRAKLLTDMGYKLFDEIEKDIDASPGVFPYSEMRDRAHQLAFDIPSLT